MGNPNHDSLGRFATGHGYSASNVSAGQRKSGSRAPGGGTATLDEHRGVTDAAYEAAKEGGGITIRLDGQQPTEGYAYAPSKTSERAVPQERLTHADIDAYIDSNYGALQQDGNHLGLWTEDGDVYMDVSRVGPASPATIRRAQGAHQLAVFDLKTFDTVNVGTINGGRYRRIDDATNLHSEHQGKVKAAAQGRGP